MRARKIVLVVLDNDGCLIRDEFGTYDLDFIAKMRDLAVQADSAPGDPVPRFTFITGRPQPFVECLQKTFGIGLPAIFENGAGLDLGGQSVVMAHPTIDYEAMGALESTRELLRSTVMRDIPSFFQPGKDYSITVIAGEPADRPRLWEACRKLHSKEQPGVEFVRAMRGVDVVVPGVDKGLGFKWLTSHMGVRPEQVAGIGDSAGDVPFLKLCGWSAAPANATDEVHATVRYTSPHEAEAGILDIMERIIDDNRRTAGKAGG